MRTSAGFSVGAAEVSGLLIGERLHFAGDLVVREGGDIVCCELHVDGELTVLGRIQGRLICARAVRLGEAARLSGELRCRSIAAAPGARITACAIETA